MNYQVCTIHGYWMDLSTSDNHDVGNSGACSFWTQNEISFREGLESYNFQTRWYREKEPIQWELIKIPWLWLLCVLVRTVEILSLYIQAHFGSSMFLIENMNKNIANIPFKKKALQWKHKQRAVQLKQWYDDVYTMHLPSFWFILKGAIIIIQ